MHQKENFSETREPKNILHLYSRGFNILIIVFLN